MKFIIRYTKSSDYPEINRLAKENNHESEEVLASKIKGCYEGCLVADLDGIIGYIISFPYSLGKSYPINSFFEQIDNPNCWYIYEVCISKEFRKKGVAKDLANSIIKSSSKTFCLTALEGSEGFWSKLGFRTFFESNQSGKKASYMMLIKNT
jgi:ribosomal protein S18 acetylase RimI-like enzyme